MVGPPIPRRPETHVSPEKPSALALALPVAAVVGATAAFQAGAALAKGLFPALGPQGTVALRVVLGASCWWRSSGRGGAGRAMRAPADPRPGLATAAPRFLLPGHRARAPGRRHRASVPGAARRGRRGSRRALDLVWTALARRGLGTGRLGRRGRRAPGSLGVAWALAAAACWAAYIVWGRAASAATAPPRRPSPWPSPPSSSPRRGRPRRRGAVRPNFCPWRPSWR